MDRLRDIALRASAAAGVLQGAGELITQGGWPDVGHAVTLGCGLVWIIAEAAARFGAAPS